MVETILEIKNLKKHFPVKGGFWGKPSGAIQAVSDVSFSLKQGEILALVGESGCGKSTLGRTLLKLLEPDSGQIFFDGQDITNFTSKQMRPLRREMQIVFQDPYASLNPRMTIGSIIAEPIKIHRLLPYKKIQDRVVELLEMVGLSDEHMTKYPHEFSGGQRQRVGIARALALNPRLIVADEPVSALDVSIQAQIINLLNDLQKKLNLSMIFISHDLKVVEYLCDRIIVMYLGKVMEVIETKKIDSISHPYTKSLLSAVPIPNPEIKKERIILSGDVPSPMYPPAGCVFHTRCPEAIAECSQVVPPLKQLQENHRAACILV